jgi:murein L,D-transpeptidase YafK
MKILKIIISLLFICIIIAITYYLYPEYKLDTSIPIQKILVLKSEGELQLLNHNKIIKTYKIAIGKNPIGEKHFEGDGKTPEGIYKIDSKNPNSVCYLNLGISYPAKKDILFAQRHGKKPGGLIKIHGLFNGYGYIGKFHRWFNWTNGCIGLTNEEMKELYDNVEIGTPIEIMP